MEAEMGRRILQCGYDFLKYWEKGPRKKEPRKKGVRLTPEGAALDAYQCSAAKWTIGFGCTEYEDGRRVRAGDTITPDQVMPLLMANVARFEALVDRLLTKDASDVMFTAHVLFAFNVGPHAYTASSLLRECNAARAPTDWRNAVDNFYSYSGVTTYAPSDAQLADAAFASKIGRNADGDPVWVNTKGEPCGFMLRSRGLVKRHMGEACLALGYDGARACEDSDLLRIDITIKHPDTAYFEERRNRWVSRIDEITDFSKVLEIAQRFPLPQPEAPQPAPAEDEARPAETSAAPAPQPKHEPVVESPQPTPAEAKPVTIHVGTKEPSIFTKRPGDVPYRIDPEAGLKPLEDSERGKAFVIQTVASVIIRVGSLGMFGTWFSGMFKLVSEDAVLGTAFMELFVPAALAVTGIVGGLVMKAYGDWRRKRGEVTATQGLY